jgi:hypothetical protein
MLPLFVPVTAVRKSMKSAFAENPRTRQAGAFSSDTYTRTCRPFGSAIFFIHATRTGRQYMRVQDRLGAEETRERTDEMTKAGIPA